MAKTIYIDSDFRCHVTDGGGMTAVETDFFDGKCAAFVEGYRFVPAGAVWMREDGKVFAGEMVAPWRDWTELDAAQREYELSCLDEAVVQLEYENALLRLGLEE